MGTRYRTILNSILFCCISFLLSASSSIAQDRFAVRLTSFPNNLFIIDLKVVSGSPQINVDLGSSCLTADCTSKYNLAGDLASVNDRIKDIAINNVIQSSTPKISGVCSDISNQNQNLEIQSQRSFNFPAAAKHTGISSINVYKDLANKYHAAYFKHTNNPALIAHATANFNPNNCNVTGSFKEYYRIEDDKFETSPKGPGPFVGAITKDTEGFEFYYVNVLVPGSVGQTKLTIPGGSAVNVISAALVTDSSATSPGPAGIAATPAFLLYRIQKQQGNAFFSSVLLQLMKVDGNTLTVVGKPKTISPFAETGAAGAEHVHSVALASNRQFACYSSFNKSCGKEVLKFQKINPNTGAKIGSPIELLGCADFANSIFGAYAIDILAIPN